MSESVTTPIREALTSLLAVFVVLKVAGLVDWSWWLVLAPFWSPCVVVVSFVCAGVLIDARRRRGAGRG